MNKHQSAVWVWERWATFAPFLFGERRSPLLVNSAAGFSCSSIAMVLWPFVGIWFGWFIAIPLDTGNCVGAVVGVAVDVLLTISGFCPNANRAAPWYCYCDANTIDKRNKRKIWRKWGKRAYQLGKIIWPDHAIEIVQWKHSHPKSN